MTIPSSVSSGRVMIILAVFLQAVGKVAFGTWLTSVPSNLFVFFSFALTAAFFLALSRKGVGAPALGALVLLNASTALTFICFFFALKLIEPAIVGAVEIGIGPLVVVLITLLTTGERPSWLRVVVCLGILAGCAVLAVAALRGSGFASFGPSAWLGLGASVAAGIGAVLITMSSRALLQRGWKFGAVLAHRFYLILPLSLALSLNSDWSSIPWSGSLTAALLLVAVVSVLAPLYLLQMGIGRCDPYTVMVTMAALPVLTFALEGFSPAYAWSWPTATGVAVVFGFLLVDVAAKKT
ncbi:DMT family transporter [Aureimonas sp. D3]|uniref:DMT family transporter n=1 Tax=Aureimonas sp. D3 TaxID=1638164 RepID=UPI000A6C3DB8|nr:DMT family transporter [Aureimonas sp. D3]